jgi:hypothetical protein
LGDSGREVGGDFVRDSEEIDDAGDDFGLGDSGREVGGDKGRESELRAAPGEDFGGGDNGREVNGDFVSEFEGEDDNTLEAGGDLERDGAILCGVCGEIFSAAFDVVGELLSGDFIMGEEESGDDGLFGEVEYCAKLCSSVGLCLRYTEGLSNLMTCP